MHDEVLARLLELNQVRAQAELRPAFPVPERRRQGVVEEPQKEWPSTAPNATASKVRKASHPKKKDDATLPMFGAVEPKEKS